MPNHGGASSGSEKGVRFLFDKNPHPMFIYDVTSLRFLDVNETAVQGYGYSREEFMQMTLADIRPPEDIPALMENIRAVDQGIDQAGIWRHRRKDGSLIYVEITSVAFDLDGKKAEIVLALDVTPRYLAEQALRTSEERFRLLAKATSDAIWDWDMEQKKLWWSDGFQTLFGYDPEVISPSFELWEELIHPEDRREVMPLVSGNLASDADLYSTEYRLRRADGSYAYVLDQAYIIRNPDGKPVRAVGGITDQSEKREIQNRLRLLASALNSAGDPILITDLEGRIEWVNATFTATTGYTEEETLGKKPGELFKSGKHDDVFYRQMWQRILDGGIWSDEMINRHKDGSLHPEHVTITPVKDPGGPISHFIAIKRDLTQEKEREQQLLRIQRMQSVGTLAGGIAHDLNNLLTPVLMGIGILKKLDMPSDARQLLHEMESSVRRGADLVKQVLTFARGTLGERGEIPLAQLIEEISSIIRNTFPRNIEFELDLPGSLPTLIGDTTQIHQVLINLCVNARDAMPNGGKMTLRIRSIHLDAVAASANTEARSGKYLQIEVRDTGTGMSKEVKEHIFEPFFSTKKTGEGTGLGLSTMLGIVRSHGGFVEVESEPNRGSGFLVYLPLERRHSKDPFPPQPVVKVTGASSGKGYRILLVDDEPAVLNTTRRTLEASGYTVLTAQNGIEALTLFASQHASIDLVLTDLMMPQMDGAALITAIQHIKPGQAIIAVTGLETGDLSQKVARMGIPRLVKPFSTDDLIQHLNKVLT